MVVRGRTALLLLLASFGAGCGSDSKDPADPGTPSNTKASISGSVIGGTAGTAVAGIEVELNRFRNDSIDRTFPSTKSTTASAGTFTFANLDAGTYGLTATGFYATQSAMPCQNSGLLVRNRQGFLILSLRLNDGRYSQSIIATGLTLTAGQARTQTIDLRC